MLSHLLRNRHTVFMLRKVFARSMPYGTYLEVDDKPARVSVAYKGQIIWSLLDENGTPKVTTDLSPIAREDLENTLASLLPQEVVNA